jgi:hypothetical protein
MQPGSQQQQPVVEVRRALPVAPPRVTFPVPNVSNAECRSIKIPDGEIVREAAPALSDGTTDDWSTRREGSSAISEKPRGSHWTRRPKGSILLVH